MAGTGFEFYYGYGTGCTDLTCEDHRSRDQKYTDAAIALQFFQKYFQAYLPDIRPDDGATSDGQDYVLRNAEKTAYAVYRPDGGTTEINLPNGNWQLRWFNPRNGDLDNGVALNGKQLVAPNSEDWVALITDDLNNGNCEDYEESNGIIIFEAENLNPPAPWKIEADNGAINNQYIRWDGGNQYNNRGQGEITAKFKVNRTGRYAFIWRMRQSQGFRSDEANDTWVNFPDARFIGVENGKDKEFTDYIKIFGNATKNFGWSATGDVNHIKYKMFVDFDQPGIYTMKLSGRSQGHQVDRILLHHTSVKKSTATNINLPETKCQNDDTGSCANNQRPTIEISSPMNNAVFEVGQTVALQSEASDNDGSLESVVFYVNNVRLGATSNSPYRLDWNPTTPGKYSIKATAQDECGGQQSANITIEIVGEPNPSSQSVVSLTLYNSDTNQPVPDFMPLLDGAIINLAEVGNQLNIVANTSPGTVGSVQFQLNGAEFSVENVAPYALAGDTDSNFKTWTPTIGKYTLLATPYSEEKKGGQKGQALLVNFEVIDQELPTRINPMVTIIQPIDGSEIPEGEAIEMLVEASDADGSIQKVEFYRNGVRLGMDDQAPYKFQFANLPVGDHELMAKAYDNQGNTAQDAILITVIAADPCIDNLPPNIAITSPNNGAIFTPQDAITIQVNARDSENNIKVVEFFNGTTKLGEQAVAPYSFTLDNLTTGSYTITAKVTDDCGANASSEPLIFFSRRQAKP